MRIVSLQVNANQLNLLNDNQKVFRSEKTSTSSTARKTASVKRPCYDC